jgi:hypothetical protein
MKDPREQAAAIPAQLTVESAPGQGTTVRDEVHPRITNGARARSGFSRASAASAGLVAGRVAGLRVRSRHLAAFRVWD